MVRVVLPLESASGKPVAPGTRYKTKGVMSVLFQHAMRYEWATNNPIRLVRQSAMPVQEEIVLAPVEVSALLAELHDPFRTPDTVSFRNRTSTR